VKEIIEELEEIANAADDNMDREGEYTSDKLQAVIQALKINFNL
jgi:hypothetical protein